MVMRTSRTTHTASRVTTLLAGLATVMLLAGCATGVPGAATAGSTASTVPVSTSATSTSSDAGCVSATADPTPEPAGDPVVMVVGETNAWEISTLWSQPVALAVYDGGGAVRPVTAGETGQDVPAMEWGRIDSCRLDDAVAELTDLAIADFGDPTVTDQGTTTVTLRAPGSEPQQIAVYALSIDAGSLTDLTAAQLANRQRLTAALTDLQAAVADPQPWTPNRVRLIGLGDAATDDPTPHQWPDSSGIDASLQRTNPDCVTFAGEPATAVLTALGDGSSTATWTDGRRTGSFTATVLVPGQPGCPE